MGKNSPGYNEVRRARYKAQQEAKMADARELTGPDVGAGVVPRKITKHLVGPKPKRAPRPTVAQKAEKKAKLATRRERLMDLHGVGPKSETALKRAPRTTVTPKSYRSDPPTGLRGGPVEPAPKPFVKSMGKSYQRAGVVASGITIKGGGKQVTITLTPAQLDFVAKMAAREGVSLSEAVRQCVNVASA